MKSEVLSLFFHNSFTSSNLKDILPFFVHPILALLMTQTLDWLMFALRTASTSSACLVLSVMQGCSVGVLR